MIVSLVFAGCFVGLVVGYFIGYVRGTHDEHDKWVEVWRHTEEEDGQS